MSDLSNRAKQRNWLKMRLMGAISVFYPSNHITTQQEREKLLIIRNLVSELVGDFNDNSRTLGFKVVNRCCFCGKKSDNVFLVREKKQYVCKNHESWV